MAAAAITPRESDTAFSPASLPGVRFIDIFALLRSEISKAFPT
jgi:hypothetical protein